MKKICLAAVLVLTLTGMVMNTAYAQTPQQTLTRYISDLQKNPTDTALREKIIRHVQTMRPAPALPAEVARHEGAAEYAFKSAKSESDFLDAAKEYEKALLIAPWHAIDYFNCGVAYEKAGQFKNAITQFNFYLMAAPNAQDAAAVLKRIGGLEYAAGKAARESNPVAIAAKKQSDYTTWLKGFDGARFVSPPRTNPNNRVEYTVLYIEGGSTHIGFIEVARLTDNVRTAPIRQIKFNDGTSSQSIQNRKFQWPVPWDRKDQRPCTATISDDGQFITVLCPQSSVPETYTRIK